MYQCGLPKEMALELFKPFVMKRLVDGSYHEVDSSEMAFKIAGSMAFKEAMRKADPVLLEPIMKLSLIHI